MEGLGMSNIALLVVGFGFGWLAAKADCGGDRARPSVTGSSEGPPKPRPPPPPPPPTVDRRLGLSGGIGDG